MTSTEVAVRETNGHVERDWIALLEPAAALANQVAGTGFVPTAMRNNPAAIVAAVLYGDELGLGPMQSLAKISVIEGKPSLSAEAQRALILAAGHELRVDEATATRFTIAGRRSGSTEWTSVTWTLDDAKRANIAGKANWRLYPRQMLAARATAELARLAFADVIGGLAATEEIEDVDPLTLPLAIAAPTTETVTKTKTTRRRRKSPAAETPPAEGPGDAPGGGDETKASPTELPPLPDEPADSLLEPVPSSDPLDDAEQGEPRGGSPAEDVNELDGESVAVEETGEVAQDDETTASSVAPDEGAASPGEPLAAKAQLKKLDAIVGSQREVEIELEDSTKVPLLSTAQVWSAVATRRNVDVDLMIELLGGRDEAGVLHWSPLRDSLTVSEASDLMTKLTHRAQKWGVTS